ncbi:related to TNA1-High affinity nicotinic acid plasma membrane permease [Ramularia collo-cygni]|uniref:Related to TNA1-High affinity nicotinic acid plasma membrane permease n=1 Tax=Ramularia collo-cygni TaxID=112498 RepID=A0A2D3UZI6_9PEZI|nr:related to TNA1-High affinity nicotinic acid plasma membrane permease [Ramularia collo-cygni]CZT14629.1 related to TNA1-High affinity nicotinic acid plasma membrane permease [Ramularia collo-cygni]
MAPTQEVQTDTQAGHDQKEKEAEVIHQELSIERNNMCPAEWLSRYPLIADKSETELKKLRKGLVRKLDWIFLPTITVMLLLGYLDRINVANARLAGLQDDLGMDDKIWSLGISAFYIGFIISQLPATVYLARGRPQIQIPLHVIACWYTKEEAPLRMAIWHAGNIISNVFSGLLAAGILTNMEGVANLRAWQWFFIIEGVAGAALGIGAFWGIPNYPHDHNVRWISPEQAELAQYRMLCSNGGVTENDDGGMWEGVKLAIFDPFTWIFTVLHTGLILALAFKDFFPSIVATLGYSDLMTYLIQAPPYVFAYIACIGFSWSAGKYMEHCWHIIATSMMSIIGTAIVISTMNVGARYFGMFFMCAGPFVGLNIHIPWETTNVFSPRTKRGALLAITHSIASATHWFSPYFFLRSQEPMYENGGILIIVGAVLGIAGCLVCKWYVKKLNKKLDEHEREHSLPKGWRYVD